MTPQQVIAAIQMGVGRKRLAKTLGISDIQARRLIQLVKSGNIQEALLALSQQKEESRPQHFTFARDVESLLLVFVGDQHIGSPNTDTGRVFAEAEHIIKTPEAYIVQLGDVVDNYIVSKLLHLNFDASMSIEAQWQLARRYFELIKDRLIAVVSGNHELWSMKLAGVDLLGSIVPGCYYDRFDLKLEVRVRSARFRIWARHRWPGQSIYNPTHGQERGARFLDPSFDIYVGAHTHAGGLYREFVLAGRKRAAIQIGTYKLDDPYGKEKGFPSSDQSTAVGILLSSKGYFLGCSSLEALCDLQSLLLRS